MNESSYYLWLDAKVDDDEIPPWKQLDIVTRKWANLSQMEKDLENYENRKKIYQD
jgi:hypothetical protein